MARIAHPTSSADTKGNGNENGHKTNGDSQGDKPVRKSGYTQLKPGEKRSWHGLSIERRYTRPGVHPYDTVEWDTREAVITNEHGKAVFEQKDLEIPKSWSQLATQVVASKYFRGQLGTPERERSVKQMIDRVADTIADWGVKDAYFATDEDADAFRNELKDILLKQRAAFNSPVWFNVGIDAKPQCSACFINSVEDTMESILTLAKTEGMLFKFGSGTGSNLSTLRSSKEHLAGGGEASGPVSFMKGFDAFAGVIKSGGKTRRAAKMVILNADHPDVEEFIDCKLNEEKKAWALIDAGYDGNFNGGEAYASVFFQNSNNSVRVTDAFMEAVEKDADWDLKAVRTGETLETTKARYLLNKMAEAAWVCGDPGIQYDDNINNWHTSANTARINASNPCVTADTLVATDEGWRRIDSLVGKTANVIGADGQPHPVDKIFPTGTKPVFELKTRSGYRVRITEDHLVATQRGDVAVKDLREGDKVFLNAPGFGQGLLSPELAEAIGLAVGDGHLSHQVIGGREQRYVVLTMHRNEARVLQAVANEVNEQKHLLRAVGMSGRPDNVNVTVSSTGARLAFGSQVVIEQFLKYAVLDEGADAKRFTDEAFSLGRDSIAGLIRGLFTADGTVVNTRTNAYVGLDSTSLELLTQVQRMLLGFGIKSHIYENRRAGKLTSLLPDGKGGMREYPVKEMHSLRITSASRLRFEKEIGFAPESQKTEALNRLNWNIGTYSDELVDRVGSITPLGEEAVYDLTERATSHFVANGLVVHNCSEYLYIDDSACNLASLNLMKFLKDDGEFDIEAFKHAARIVLTAQEIIVDNASYPTPRIGANSRDFRPLGLGYANLGALLMNRGLAYDSEDGRVYAAAITAIMQGEAELQSARIARDQGGPFPGYKENREPYLKVMAQHRDAAYQLQDKPVPEPLIDAALTTWDEVLALGEKAGFRNGQVSVLAPTGTIAFLMDCDTTGVEPDIALIKYKRLVGGGYLKIVNQTVPHALKQLGYDAKQTEEIVAYIDEHETIEGAPHLKAEHLSVFDCAFKPANGSRSIHYNGHLKMMAAVQPFISGAISKTVNMPEHSTPADIAQVYIDGWKLGLKAIAVYRDNSKRSQPLNTKKEGGSGVAVGQAAAEAVVATPKPYRRRLPDERASITHKFNVGGHEGYLTIGLYEDGTPGEIFLRMAKEGSTISGLMDSFATAVSLALQYGVPLRDLVNKFSHLRFEPAGFTTNREIPMAKSLVDYIFRYMATKFLSRDEQDQVGIINRQMTLTEAKPMGGEASEDTTTAAGSATAAPAASPAAQPQTTSGPARDAETVGEAAPGPDSEPVEVAPGQEEAGLLDGLKILARNQEAQREERLEAGQAPVIFDTADSPACTDCGSIMVRNGSCYKCINCGSTSGCS
jgi:ribonucleoside-diphosphate reductase alpha chain